MRTKFYFAGSKDHLRKQLLLMKFSYTHSGVNRKVLMEKQDVVLSRVRYLRRIKELKEAGYTNQPCHSEMLARQHYWTKDAFFLGELLNFTFNVYNNFPKKSMCTWKHVIILKKKWKIIDQRVSNSRPGVFKTGGWIHWAIETHSRVGIV